MSEDLVYNLDEIIDFGTSLPEGEYLGKVIAVEIGTTKKGDPKITATFEVTEGEYAGHTFDKQYFMKQGKTKNGATWCSGISDFRADARALGEAAKLPKQITLKDARKVFAQVLTTSKRIEFEITKVDDRTDPSKKWSRLVIHGKAGSSSVKSDASDPLAEMFG